MNKSDQESYINVSSQQLPLFEDGDLNFDFSSYFLPVMIGFAFTMIPAGLVIDFVYDWEGYPNFGEYLLAKEKTMASVKATTDILASGNPKRLISTPFGKVSSVQEVIGLALDQIGSYAQLNTSQQMVALINEDMCINCGKCYMTCNDSGYQVIKFDDKTHLPIITKDCTGCTLCVSVCPIIDCIKMIKREDPYIPNRGIPLDEGVVPRIPNLAPRDSAVCQ